MYDDFFEMQFLKQTQTEFMMSANRWTNECNCPEYLQRVKSALINEETNADFWLMAESKPKMLKIVEQELISKMAEQIA